MMNKIRALLHPSKTSPSLDPSARNINVNAPSTFNNVSGHQFNVTHTYIHRSTSSSHAPPSNVTPFNDAPIDQLSVHFTGRKKELALIAGALEKRRRRKIPARCVLFGNQGVGKSQLTYAWANATYTRRENSYILWISATTVEKLYQGFSRLLRFIDHPDSSHPDDGIRLEAARRWLEGIKTGNWLLVLDNVFPETLDFLRQNLPRQNGRGTILFTTRTERVALALASTAGERHDIIEVPLLDVTAGADLFCGHFESGLIDPLSPKIVTIVKAVGCLPLAISHAAWYMKESHSSLDDMLALYQSRHKIDVITWEHTLSDYEHKSVAATFIHQLQDLEQHSPDASNLLRTIAFFDPESIPLEMLITGAKAIVEAQQPPTRSPLISSLLALLQSPITLQNAITHIQTRCLVTYHAGSQSPTFRIHDLIQLVILENTRSCGLDREFFEFAVELACGAFGKIKEPSLPGWWPQCELLVPHIQSLTLRQDTSRVAKNALLLVNYHRGLYLSKRGRFAEAQSLCETILADRERLFALDDLETLAVMHELACLYERRGRYGDAETLINRVLESRETQLGPEHRDTLKGKTDLARVYYFQQRFNDAEPLLEKTLQSQESQCGLEDSDTLRTMIWLAEIYNQQHSYDRAESLLTRALQVLETLLGSEHVLTLNAKHFLAKVYSSQQRYDTAAALFEKTLQPVKTHLGSEHPETLETMHCLAVVYTSQGRYRDAKDLLVHVLAARDHVLGFPHPRTQNTVRQLAWVYKQLGCAREARVLEQRISPSSS